MMARVWTLVALLCGCMQGMYGQGTLTIQDIIRGRPELSQLEVLMRSTDIFSALGQTTVKFTLFAPNNAAMQALPPSVSRSMDKDDKEQLLNYHVVLAGVGISPWTLSTMKNARVETSARNAPKIFFRTYVVGQQTNHYVNGAQVVEGDIQAQNGVVHIVDSVLYPIAVKQNALALMEASAQNSKLDDRTKTFTDLLNKARYISGSPYGSLNSDTTFVTIFVPTDRSLTKVLTTKRKEELMKDSQAIVKLLSRHVIVHSVLEGSSNEGVMAVWHATLLNHAIDGFLLTGRPLAIPAMEGDIKPVRIGNTLFVTNMCGMVKVKDLPESVCDEKEDDDCMNYQSTQPHYSSEFKVTPDVTVNNGVVHFVDGLLGYIYNDAIEMLEEDEVISKFKDHVRMSTSFVDRLTVVGGKDVSDSNKLTIFAPINGAFVNLERAGNIDLTQDAELREKMLGMHMVQSVLNLVDIRNDTRKKTLREDTDVYSSFYTDSTGTYVEVKRVRARIVKADVCVQNGIIHYIDNLLGMPYRNLLDEIKELDMLSDLYEAILKTPQFVEGNRNGLRTIKHILENTDQPRTAFGPNSNAFRTMRTTRIGREYMADSNQFKLYHLLLRHMPVGDFFIEDNIRGKQSVPSAQDLFVFKEGEDYFVEYAGDYGGVQAKILQRNLRLTNGVLHVIDAVLYEDNQLAFESVSGTPLCIPSATLLALCLLKYIL